MGPMKSKAISFLKIAEQIGEEAPFHPVDANVEEIATRSRCDRIGPGLKLSRIIESDKGDELSRLEIELFQFLYCEFKMETSAGFRQKNFAR